MEQNRAQKQNLVFDSDGKESVYNAGDPGFFLGREDPRRRDWLPITVFLPGEFHRLRGLMGYSAWSCKESDTTEQLTLSLVTFNL